MNVVKDIKKRVNISFIALVLIGIAVITRAGYIQVKEGPKLKAIANKTHTKTQTLYPERGNIYTEDRKILSATIPKFDIRIDMSVINVDTFNNNVDSIAYGLSKIFNDANAASYRRKLVEAYKEKRKYWLLKKDIPYYNYQAVRQLPVFRKAKNKGGFMPESKTKRVNPYGMLAYRTIGLWRENAQVVGLEKTYNEELSGQAGSRIERKVANGEWIPLEGSEIDPVNGKDIITTIDIGIQDVTENALLEVMQKYESLQGTAIVMEVHTGKIRAMANLGRQKDGTYWEDFNYALIPSEPGSVFKLLSLYALFEDGYLNINSKVNCFGGLYRVGKQTVRDDHKGLGMITLEDAFAQSSNVAFASTINKYYSENPMKYIKHLQKLGLDKTTGIDLLGERPPLIKTTKSVSWNKVTSLPWIAYGYESLITPMHTAMIYNAVANNGKLMKPYLVSEIVEDGIVVKKFAPTVLVNKIGKDETIKQLQQATRAVVIKGTGKAAQSPYYNSAGKTGTAQVADMIGDKFYRYGDGVKQGSFVAYFPAENPQYTITIVVRSKPHGVYYGAAVGVPIYKAIADKLYTSRIGGWKVNTDSLSSTKEMVSKVAPANQLQILSRKFDLMTSLANSEAPLARLENTDKKDKYKIVSQTVEKHKVPNVVGMGLKEALFLLENSGLKVKVSGAGSINNQSIAPGTTITKGSTIQLQLN